MDEPHSIVFNEVFERAPIGIMIADAEGLIEQCNPAYRELLGYQEEEVVGRKFLDFVHPEDRVANQAQFNQLKTQEIGLYDIENRYVSKDGAEVFVHKHVFSLPNTHGGAVKVVGLITDMSAQKQVAEEISHMRRLEAIGRLASNIAHDSGNLLSIIAGNLELALPHIRGQFAREKIRNALTATDIGAAFNRRILSMARRRPYRPETCDLNQLVRTASPIIGRVIGDDIDLVLDLDNDLSLCRVDPGEVDSSLLNLVTNARDAMTGGGEIIVATRNVQRVNEQKAVGFVELSVRDNGHGMSPDVLQKASEPFFTTKPQGKGTGLGLSSVGSFAQQAGGMLEIESQPGDGTAVRLLLPATG